MRERSRAEYERTLEAVLKVCAQRHLLKGLLLTRLIKLRNPYVDPMHYARVLLRSVRNG